MSEPGQVAVFARADHPKGYAMAQGRAHGYSVLLVGYANPDQLEALKLKLAHQGTKLPDRIHDGSFRWLPWYGGRFDYLFSFGGEPERERWDNPVLSLGDNRCLSLWEAHEILEEPVDADWSRY